MEKFKMTKNRPDEFLLHLPLNFEGNVSVLPLQTNLVFLHGDREGFYIRICLACFYIYPKHVVLRFVTERSPLPGIFLEDDGPFCGPGNREQFILSRREYVAFDFHIPVYGKGRGRICACSPHFTIGFIASEHFSPSRGRPAVYDLDVGVANFSGNGSLRAQRFFCSLILREEFRPDATTQQDGENGSKFHT